jgi:hypothetical protein
MQLIAYFGQHAAPCGKCDVCAPVELAEAPLLAFLAEAKSIDELQAHFLTSKGALEALIRPLMLTEKIKYSAGKFYL